MVLVAGEEVATVPQPSASPREETISELGAMFRTCLELLMAIIGLAVLRPGVKAPRSAPNRRRQPDGSPNPLYDPAHEKPNPSPPPPKKRSSSP